MSDETKKPIRYYRRDIDVALVWSVDEDGMVIDAAYVWDSDQQLAEPDLLSNAVQHAGYLEEVGDMDEPESGSDADRVREALECAKKEQANREWFRIKNAEEST